MSNERDVQYPDSKLMIGTYLAFVERVRMPAPGVMVAANDHGAHRGKILRTQICGSW